MNGAVSLRRRTAAAWDDVGGLRNLLLALRMVGWAVVLRLLKRVVPLPRLVRLMWGGGARKKRAAQSCGTVAGDAVRKPAGVSFRAVAGFDEQSGSMDRVERIARIARVAARVGAGPGDRNCLTRSLLVYRYLSRETTGLRLVVGIHRTEGELRGHAWVTMGGEPVAENADSLAEFVPVIAFGANGVGSRLGITRRKVTDL
jgi:hypothetical protein